MTALLDILSPTYIGEDRISLSIAPGQSVRAGTAVRFTVDYSAVGDSGLMLPLEFIVQPGFGAGGPANGYVRRVFRYYEPSEIVYTPPSAGLYLAVLREIAHNRWQGRLTFTAGGDAYDATIRATR